MSLALGDEEQRRESAREAEEANRRKHFAPPNAPAATDNRETLQPVLFEVYRAVRDAREPLSGPENEFSSALAKLMTHYANPQPTKPRKDLISSDAAITLHV